MPAPTASFCAPDCAPPDRSRSRDIALTYFCRRRSIVSTTPADDATDVAVGTSITVKLDDSIVSVKAQGAIEVRLHTAPHVTDLRKVVFHQHF